MDVDVSNTEWLFCGRDKRRFPRRTHKACFPTLQKFCVPDILLEADSGGRAVQVVGLQLLVCWNCGFESRRGHDCLLQMLCVVQVVTCATGRTLALGVLSTVCVCVFVCMFLCVFMCMCVCVCVRGPLSVLKCNNNLNFRQRVRTKILGQNG